MKTGLLDTLCVLPEAKMMMEGFAITHKRGAWLERYRAVILQNLPVNLD